MSKEPLISFCYFLSEMHKCSSNLSSGAQPLLPGSQGWLHLLKPKRLRIHSGLTPLPACPSSSQPQQAEQQRSGTLGIAGVCAWGNQTQKMFLVWYWACLPLGPTRILPLPAVWFTMRPTCSTIYQQNYHWNRTKINATWCQDPSERLRHFSVKWTTLKTEGWYNSLGL